jgi:xylulose-5-phosphate/fructose-6-phosphate phosphoketolase
MGSNPYANGGLLRKTLHLLDFHQYAIAISTPDRVETSNTYPWGVFLRDIIMRLYTRY